MDTDTASRAQCNRYREIANELHLLVPKMKHADAAQELRLLAISYERLAEHLEAAPDPRRRRKVVVPIEA